MSFSSKDRKLNTISLINNKVTTSREEMESILIVDDDINLCKVLKEELTEVGYDAEYVNERGFCI